MAFPDAHPARSTTSFTGPERLGVLYHVPDVVDGSVHAAVALVLAKPSASEYVVGTAGLSASASQQVAATEEEAVSVACMLTYAASIVAPFGTATPVNLAKIE